MSTPHRRPRAVVVVGVGAITAQGPTADDLWAGLAAGRVAIGPVKHLSMAGYRTSIAAEVTEEFGCDTGVRYPAGWRDRALDFVLTAAAECMQTCAPARAAIPRDRWGLVLSTCNAGLLSAEQWFGAVRDGGEPDPRMLAFSTPQGLAEAVAGVYRIEGPVHSINTACAAGANAVGRAAELIRRGEADAMLTGGTDALSDVLVAGFNSLESLSPDPAAPYSKGRRGLSLGEGSGMLVLLRDDLARDLGLTALAEIAGVGLSADGYHPTAPQPQGEGAGRAMSEALRAAGLAPADVAYVNSHGTGTQKNDSAETLAIRRALGDSADDVAVSSSKSMIGHLLGAAGAVESIITVKALQHQLAPPTAGLDEPAPDCDLDYVPLTARPMPIAVAMCNNFAFGGANAALVITEQGRAEPAAVRSDRVVVTGIGAITTAGVGTEALWQAYRSARDCTVEESGARIGRMVLDEAAKMLPPRKRRRMDRLGLASVLCASLALVDGGLTVDEHNAVRTGAVLGTGIGPMESMEDFSTPVLAEGPQAANPAVFPNTVYNAATGQVAINLGTLGPTTTTTSGHAAGAAAITYCADLLADDRADAMVAISADTLTDSVVAGYRALDLLGTDGIGLSEAGVAVLLERASAAAERGAVVLAEVLGHASTSDGRGVGRWDPIGRGMERAMRLAVERAGLVPGDIGAVWSSMTGHRLADRAEARAIARVFPDGATEVRAPRTTLGEPIGAGAALNTALAVTTWAHEGPGAPVLVNSASFGGSYVCMVLAPGAPTDTPTDTPADAIPERP